MSPPTRIVWIKVKDMKIHPTAQRDLNPHRVRKLVAQFNRDAIGTLHAVEYAIKGVLAIWIVDGQHRVVTLIQLGLGDIEFPVEIHDDIKDDAGAANLFIVLNDRFNVAAFEMFDKGVLAGYEDWVGVKREFDAVGLRAVRGRGGSHYAIACVGDCRKIWQMDEGETLQRTLAVSLSAWGDDRDGVDGKLLLGIARVLSSYDGIDDSALSNKLAKYQGRAAGIIGAAKGRRQTKPGASLAECVGDVVVDLYNVGRRNGRLAR